MATATATQMNFNGISQIGRPRRDPFSRHIPIKRFAACPPSENIVAEAKRCRLLYPATLANNRVATPLAVQNMQNENIARSTGWAKSNCFQSYCVVNSPVTSCVGSAVAKGLRYDHINSGNVPRASLPVTTPANEPKKSRCCPIMMTTTEYSTPPYCTGGATEVKRARRRPLSHRLKRRSWDGNKAKNTNTGCLSVVKNAAAESVKTLQACVEKSAAQPEMNALSVYHAFLKQREEATKTTTSLSQQTNSTMLNQASNATCRRGKDGELRYSNNFVPQLTSTPQKGKRNLSSVQGSIEPPATEMSGFTGSVKTVTDARVKRADGETEGNSFTDVLKALEEERRAGSSHIMLPIPELEDMVRNLQKQDGDAVSYATSGGSAETNNNDQYPRNDKCEGFRAKQKRVRPKLPGMYPIGAPRDASSPIASTAKSEFRIFDESVAHPLKQDYVASRKRHAAGDQARFAVLAKYDDDVWRPW